jgi:hypothetical protein
MRGALGGVVSALVASAAVPAAERDRIVTAATIAVRRRRRPAMLVLPCKGNSIGFYRYEGIEGEVQVDPASETQPSGS